MNAKQAIREERTELHKKRRTLEARIAEIRQKEKALDAALAVLEGRENGRRGRRGVPDSRPRISRDKLADRIESIVRNAPAEKFEVVDLAEKTGRAHSSVYRAVALLIKQKRVYQTGMTSRGMPIVSRRERTVVPGEGVRP